MPGDSRVDETVTRTGRAKVIIAGTGLDVCAQLPALTSAADSYYAVRRGGCLRSP